MLKKNFWGSNGEVMIIYTIVNRIKMENKYSNACVKWPLKNRQNKDLNDKWLLNEGQNYCRMLPLEHSAILLTCIMDNWS